jgi:hypothetical protein
MNLDAAIKALRKQLRDLNAAIKTFEKLAEKRMQDERGPRHATKKFIRRFSSSRSDYGGKTSVSASPPAGEAEVHNDTIACRERTTLLVELSRALRMHSENLRVLRAKSGTSAFEDHQQLGAETEQSRMAKDRARVNLERHVAQHGCGDGRQAPEVDPPQ